MTVLETFSLRPPNGGNEVSKTFGCPNHARALSSCALRGRGVVRFIHHRPDEGAMSADYVVQVVDEDEDGAGPLGVVRVIWYEISGGIGPWGALRPLIAIALAMGPSNGRLPKKPRSAGASPTAIISCGRPHRHHRRTW